MATHWRGDDLPKLNHPTGPKVSPKDGTRVGTSQPVHFFVKIIALRSHQRRVAAEGVCLFTSFVRSRTPMRLSKTCGRPRDFFIHYLLCQIQWPLLSCQRRVTFKGVSLLVFLFIKMNSHCEKYPIPAAAKEVSLFSLIDISPRPCAQKGCVSPTLFINNSECEDLGQVITANLRL